MSGHSHWAGIKHKKAAVDAKRGKLWSKLARKMTMAAKMGGGGDPDSNARLRLAIDKARAANMTRDGIDRAIKKGTGELGSENYEEITYEGYAPGGVALMCETLTDNRNRTSPEIKKIFETRGGNMGSSGCVSYLFDRLGLCIVSTADASEDQLLEVVLDAGADDIRQSGDIFEILCEPDAIEAVKKALDDAEIATTLAELSMVPQNTITVDAETGRKVLTLIDVLNDHEDVQNVYANFDIPDDVMAQLAAEQE